MRLERVVIGMDFSTAATAAAAWTARHFAPDAELVLVHAIVVPEVPRFLRDRTPPTDTLIATARLGANQRMRELSASLGARLIWPDIRVGPAAEQIAKACDEYDADVAVVGAHGVRPARWGRLGSTAEQLVRMAPVPVLLASALRNAPPRQILVPVNDSDLGPWVVRWARFLAERFGAHATVVYVVGPAVFSTVLSMTTVGTGSREAGPETVRTELLAETDQWLARLLADEDDRDAITTTVVFGEPGEEIVAAAKRLNADLIVMGSRGLKGIPRLVLGSVASHVLRHAPCPTLVVKAPEDEIVD